MHNKIIKKKWVNIFVLKQSFLFVHRKPFIIYKSETEQCSLFKMEFLVLELGPLGYLKGSIQDKTKPLAMRWCQSRTKRAAVYM